MAIQRFCSSQHMSCSPVPEYDLTTRVRKSKRMHRSIPTHRLPALSNTAATFFALWVGEKSAEFLKGRLIWLSIFGGSITLWQVHALQTSGTFV